MKLKSGEYKCETCNGKGKIPAEDNPNCMIGIKGSMSTCPNCHGSGKLDWIENIVGKKKPASVNLTFPIFDYVDLIKPMPKAMREATSKLAKELANKIDAEILSAFTMGILDHGETTKKIPEEIEPFGKKGSLSMRQLFGDGAYSVKKIL